MLDLHEVLSEFSYGYGVTREVEKYLRSVGLHVTPFFPNLVQEASLGFDVGFRRPGRPLLLQFKLGEEMKRLRGPSIPLLARPFWRFSVDTSNHQFRNLYVRERHGAEVYYVAPRFSEWEKYEEVFLAAAVLEQSLLIKPSTIRRSVLAAGGKSGYHRVIYDANSNYVCSEPRKVQTPTPREMAEKLLFIIREKPIALGTVVSRVSALPRERRRATPRRAVLDKYQSEADRNAVMLGLDTWSQGIQLIFVYLPLNS